MSKITVASDVLGNYGGKETVLEARLYVSKTFSPSTGGTIVGSRVQGPDFYLSIPCTIIDGQIHSSTFVIDSTTDALDNPDNTSYALGLFTVDGDYLGLVHKELRVDHSPANQTISGIVNFSNTEPPPPLPDTYYTAAQTNLAIEQAIVAIPDNGDGSVNLNKFGSLSAALASIGSAEKVLNVSENATISSPTVIPDNVTVRFMNNSRFVKSGTGTLTFEGVGLFDPLSEIPIFSGFGIGEVLFDGACPSDLSSNLWNYANLDAKLKRAIAAVNGLQCNIKAFPGDFMTKVTVVEGCSIEMLRGQFTGSHSDTLMIVQSNTRVYGQGLGQTFWKETPHSPEFIRSSGQESSPFAGYNENIIVEDISFVGNDLTAVDASRAAVWLGNLNGGGVQNCAFESTHGFAAFVGGFSNDGYNANACFIRNNIARHLQTQYFGTVGGNNIHINGNTCIARESVSSFSFIDVEPNANTEGSDNVMIYSNIFDARLAQTSCNGITVQQGYSAHVSNVKIFGNEIIGMNNRVVTCRSTDIDVTANEFTAYSHGYETGQKIELRRDDNGNGGSLPGGFPGAAYSGWVIRTGIDKLKIASSLSNAKAGTAVDVTSQGAGSYILTPERLLSNGIQLFNVDTCSAIANTIIGASQCGIAVSYGYDLTIKLNKLIGCGGGGIAAMVIDGVANSEISNNELSNSPHAISQSAMIEETDLTLEVTATNGSSVVDVDSDKTLPWFWRGATININGTDYTIYTRHAQSIVLTTTVGGDYSGNATLKISSNRYQSNVASSVQLASTGFSYIESTAGDKRQKNVADANYTVLPSDGLVVFPTLTAPRTIALPTATTCRGKEFTFKDGSGNANTHNLTVDGDGSQTIDGAATQVINAAWGSMKVKSDGANWIKI